MLRCHVDEHALTHRHPHQHAGRQGLPVGGGGGGGGVGGG